MNLPKSSRHSNGTHAHHPFIISNIKIVNKSITFAKYGCSNQTIPFHGRTHSTRIISMPHRIACLRVTLSCWFFVRHIIPHARHSDSPLLAMAGHTRASGRVFTLNDRADRPHRSPYAKMAVRPANSLSRFLQHYQTWYRLLGRRRRPAATLQVKTDVSVSQTKCIQNILSA